MQFFNLLWSLHMNAIVYGFFPTHFNVFGAKTKRHFRVTRQRNGTLSCTCKDWENRYWTEPLPIINGQSCCPHIEAVMLALRPKGSPNA